VKTQTILRQNAVIFCAFQGECHFKKLVTKENERQPKPRYAICIWKDRCNQQINHPKAVLQDEQKNWGISKNSTLDDGFPRATIL